MLAEEITDSNTTGVHQGTEEMDEEFIFFSGALIMSFSLLLYMTLGSLMEKFKPVFGHEASYIIIIGSGFSYLLYLFG